MRQSLALLIGAVVCSVMATAALGAPTHDDIYYLGPRPILLRLHLEVDGEAWAQARQKLAARQFQLLDDDKDGRLTFEQLEGLPLKQFDNLEQWDQSKDEKLDEAEFLELFSQIGQSPFLLAEGAGNAASRIKLFPHLDTNQDGRLTETEIAAGRMSLSSRDFDDDETISTAELAPFSNPLVQQVAVGREAPLDSSAPFISVTDYESSAEVATVLVQRYGVSESDDEQPIACEVTSLVRGGMNIATFDANQDGKIDSTEMEAWVIQHEPDVELQVELPSRKSRRPKIRLKSDRIRAIKRKPPSWGTSRLAMTLGKANLELRAISSVSRTNDNRNFYLAQFLIADADKNQYLEASELGGLRLNVPFERIDANGDEKIFRDELSAYLDRDEFGSQAQVVLSVAADTKTLFHTLDVDYDQRITAREFKNMASRLKSLDANNDNAIDTNEITQQFRLSFSMGKPRVFREAMTTQRNQNRPSATTTPNADAPDWFNKMDRNQDGDLSWREFLGQRSTFESLDQDQDGLVTVAELGEYDE